MADAILLVGGPGSTKGTQGSALQMYLNADPNTPSTHVVMGDVFRTIAADNDEYGKYIHSFTSQGRLVPDKEMLPCLGKALLRIPEDHTLILDGTCRSLEQTRVQVREILPPRVKNIMTLILDCSDDVMRGRLRKRGRDDDKLDEAIEARIDAYRQSELAVANFLSQMTEFRRVKADGSAVEIGIQILRHVNTTLA